MEKTSLFADFNTISTKEWKNKIQFELNGADYSQKLVWESLEGIKVKPFYDVSDQKFTTHDTPKHQNWKITQSIYVTTPIAANKKALELLKNGVDSIQFILPNETISIALLLQHIDTAQRPIHLTLWFLSFAYMKSIAALGEKVKKNIFLHIDPVGNLGKQGNWFYSYEKDFDILNAVSTLNFDHLLCIDTTNYQNAGATMVQQLSYAMAHANEYLNFFDQKEKGTSRVQKITFKVAVGSNYFFEISKLRALRILWHTLAGEYGISKECHIIALPSKRNKTLYEYNTNMMRTTMESMASILGGADTIINLPYDSLYHKDNEFGNRLALNQLLLLREESHFNASTKASDGSYYIEALTDQLAQKALLLFKEVEKKGGFLSQLKNHSIQKKIKESAQKEQELFDAQKLVLVGSNKYQHHAHPMSQELELYPFVKTNIRKTLLEPILERRLSEKLEKQRLERE